MTDELERKLSRQIEKILATKATQAQQALLGRIAKNLGREPLELAAALLYLEPATLAAYRELAAPPRIKQAPANNSSDHQAMPAQSAASQQFLASLNAVLKLSEPKIQADKMVRYRLEIGHKHAVSSDEIKNVLINESGVDRNTIGHVEIHNSYTLVDLPPGMPPDIFQLLQTVEIKQQALQIKRVNTSRKKSWQRRNNSAKNCPANPDTKPLTRIKDAR